MSVMVRLYVDICRLPGGTGGAAFSGAPISNTPGYGGSPVGGGPGTVPNGQTIRLQQSELVPGTIDQPTAANIGTAITTAATDLQAQITTAMIAAIDNWRLGGE